MSNINYYSQGNGLTVCDKARPLEHGDYCKIAHISPDRVVTYYKEDVTKEDRETIAVVAATSNPSVSVTQPDTKVFRI